MVSDFDFVRLELPFRIPIRGDREVNFLRASQQIDNHNQIQDTRRNQTHWHNA
jgi:hypothetical protein